MRKETTGGNYETQKEEQPQVRATSFATAPEGESPGRWWKRTERVGDNKQRVQETAIVYETKVYFGKKAHTQKSVILLI